VFIIAPFYQVYVHDSPEWGYSEQNDGTSSKIGAEQLPEGIFRRFLDTHVENTSSYMSMFFLSKKKNEKVIELLLSIFKKAFIIASIYSMRSNRLKKIKRIKQRDWSIPT
jgi:predicted AAA+ superfamily ATPase